MKAVKTSEVKKIFEFINKSNKILITGHIRPDGDVIGSALGLFLGIRKKFHNKIIDIFFVDPIPEQFTFLPEADKVKFGNQNEFPAYDLCIMLECSDISRVGGCIDLNMFKYIVNIDHHLTNHKCIKNFDRENVVSIIYPEYSSCAEIIFSILNQIKIKLDKNIALCLYTGLVTDTGMFQWSNTNQHSFYTAMKLLAYGVQPYVVYKNIYRQKSYNSIMLLSKVLSTLKIKNVNGYKIAEMTVTQKMLKETNTTMQDTEEFINLPMSIKGVQLAIFFKQEKKDLIKISFRSDGINVEKLARRWSGGGHRYAGGATVKDTLRGAKTALYNYLNKVL